jgi:hypothetical protein
MKNIFGTVERSKEQEEDERSLEELITQKKIKEISHTLLNLKY